MIRILRFHFYILFKPNSSMAFIFDRAYILLIQTIQIMIWFLPWRSLKYTVLWPVFYAQKSNSYYQDETAWGAVASKLRVWRLLLYLSVLGKLDPNNDKGKPPVTECFKSSFFSGTTILTQFHVAFVIIIVIIFL